MRKLLPPMNILVAEVARQEGISVDNNPVENTIRPIDRPQPFVSSAVYVTDCFNMSRDDTV